MFDIVNIVRFISFLTYLGFLTASITGFVEVSNKFNLCVLLISILVFISALICVYAELALKLTKIFYGSQNVFYTRFGVMLVTSIMVTGLSTVGLGFGIWGFIFSFVNLLCGLFNVDKKYIVKYQNATSNTEV